MCVFAEGLLLFEEFLKSEFSEENIQFWKACERFKTVSMETLPMEAKAISDEYILQRAPKWVSPLLQLRVSFEW